MSYSLTVKALALVASFVLGVCVCFAEPPDTNYDEAKVPEYTLPSLEANDLAHWESKRRAEIIQQFEKCVYGSPPSDAVRITADILEGPTEALEGLAIRRQVRLTLAPMAAPKRKLQFEVLIYSPKSKGKAPAFLGLNFSGNQCVHNDGKIRRSPAGGKATGEYAGRWQVPMLIKRGYGLVTAHRDDIDPDNYRHDFTDGPHPLFYKEGQTQPASTEWGSIGGWAWALSNIRRWLENDVQIDAKRIAVIGHSRLGKTALWAGAQDVRFKMVVSNNSGCGGAALYRRCYGERIHHMLKPVGYWFCKNHATFAHKEHELPVDQHMLMAAIAPRALYVASATQDRWADPKGEFLALKNAEPAYALYDLSGLPSDELPKPNKPLTGGKVGYHLRDGKHDVTAFDWQQYLDFADRHLKP